MGIFSKLSFLSSYLSDVLLISPVHTLPGEMATLATFVAPNHCAIGIVFSCQNHRDLPGGSSKPIHMFTKVIYGELSRESSSERKKNIETRSMSTFMSFFDSQ